MSRVMDVTDVAVTIPVFYSQPLLVLSSLRNSRADYSSEPVTQTSRHIRHIGHTLLLSLSLKPK